MIFDKTWSLFLDRDGVLNHDKVGGYVVSLTEFQLMSGVKEAMKKLSEIFGVIVVCTNQRGVTRGLYSIEEMQRMNRFLLQEIQQAGGRIDKIYYALDLNDEAPNRKPNIGMALQAQQDFPSIDFSKSIMIGNSISDMKFARNAGMAKAIFLTTTLDISLVPEGLADAHFDSLVSATDNLLL
jgi:D,D-heptose 1,7-bisphosphate phosphatase